MHALLQQCVPLIAASDETASVLAQRFDITEQTVYKWKKRESVQDRSHTAHRLQTQLTPAQEIVVVHLRLRCCYPLMTCWPLPASSSAAQCRARA